MAQVESGQLIIRSTGLRSAIHQTLDESDSDGYIDYILYYILNNYLDLYIDQDNYLILKPCKE